MQISQGGGMVAIENPPGITNLILWDSGRVVFRLDGVYREAHLAPSLVANLVDAAEFLYDLDNYVSTERYPTTDLPSAFFTVETAPGQRKSVEVYGLDLVYDWPPESEINPAKIGVVEKLRALWEMVVDALPDNAPVMQPTVLPILHEYQYRHERPRHPNATAYDIYDPNYGNLYRFSGVSQEEMASWYKEAMPELGWIMVKEEGADFQVWAVGRYDEYMLEFRFHPDSFFIQEIFVEQNVPHHQNSILGGCAGSWCQLLREGTLAEAKAWFHEYMGYLGWMEKDTGVYYRSDGDLTEIIRFGFRTESGGIAVNIEEHRQISPAWWPSPISTPSPTST
jgi:hypothetical protein